MKKGEKEAKQDIADEVAVLTCLEACGGWMTCVELYGATGIPSARCYRAAARLHNRPPEEGCRLPVILSKPIRGLNGWRFTTEEAAAEVEQERAEGYR